VVVILFDPCIYKRKQKIYIWEGILTHKAKCTSKPKAQGDFFSKQKMGHLKNFKGKLH
jgi:hypothetical protein